MIFQFILEFMCTDKNNYKNKMNLPHPSFHSYLNCWKTTKSNDKNKWTYLLFPSTDFLIVEKLPSLVRLWNFQNFSLFLLAFCEKLSVIAWGDCFVL